MPACLPEQLLWTRLGVPPEATVARRLLVGRELGTAAQRVLVEPGAGEQAADRADMDGLALVRRARHRDLGVSGPDGIDRAPEERRAWSGLTQLRRVVGASASPAAPSRRPSASTTAT